MGRKKIKIQPIEGERNRSATYLKRKFGLFKKAYELAVLTDSEIAVMVFGRNGKLAEFCSGDIDEFLLRYTEYNGTVEKRGPEHFAHDSDEKSDENDERLPAPAEPSFKRERTHSAVHASSRARLDNRRHSHESQPANDNVSPRGHGLAAPAVVTDSRGAPPDVYQGLGKRRAFSHTLGMPAYFPADRDASGMRMSDWGAPRAESAASLMPVPEAASARRWSSGLELDLPAQSSMPQHAMPRRLSDTLANVHAGEMHGVPVSDASSRMLHAHGIHPSAPPPTHGVPEPAPPNLSIPLPNPASSFSVPMNANFLAPAHSPTTPTTPTNTQPPVLGIPQPIPSPHDTRIDGGVLASPLTPVHPGFPGAMPQPTNSPYQYDMKVHQGMSPAPMDAMPSDVKRFVPTQGPEIYFSTPDRAPLPNRAPRPGQEGTQEPSPTTNMMLPQEQRPNSPTANPISRSMFVSQ